MDGGVCRGGLWMGVITEGYGWNALTGVCVWTGGGRWQWMGVWTWGVHPPSETATTGIHSCIRIAFVRLICEI